VATGARACGVAILPDGGIGEPMCEPEPPPTMQCMPPYADYIGRYYANDSSGSGSLTGALPPQGQIGGMPMSGAPPTPAPGPGGENTGTPKSGTTPSASSGDTGGCQVGHGNAGTGASLLALAGLLGLSRRRRFRVR
jgi:MYXO-CTERM domain-containing protein